MTATEFGRKIARDFKRIRRMLNLRIAKSLPHSDWLSIRDEAHKHGLDAAVTIRAAKREWTRGRST